MFTVITNALQASLNIAWQILDGVWQWIENAAVTVYAWATNVVSWWWDNVIVPAINFVHDVINWAVDALQFAINLVQDALDWVLNNLVVPAFDWIVHAAETVGGWIWDAIDGFYRDVILPIVSTVEGILNELGQVADFVWHGLLDVYHAIVKAWDWVVWFGEHTFDDIRALLFDAEHSITRDWLLGAASDPNGWSGKLADDLARIIE